MTSRALAPFLGLAAIVAATLVACAAATVAPLTTAAEDSTTVWGGEHARLQFRKDSLPRIDYDCAYGEMDRVPTPDANGNFTVTGFHVIGHGGPIRVGEPEDRHPAVYTGALSGSTMVLRVRMTDTRNEIGPYTLNRGNKGLIMACL